MKICTNCNHILRDDETVCPYCAAQTGVTALKENEPAVSQEDEVDNAVDIVDEVRYATATIELPVGFSADNSVLSDTIDTSFSDEYEFPEEEAEAQQEPEEEESAGGEAQRADEEPEGALELELRDLAKARKPETTVLGKVGVTFVALLITAVFVFAVACLVRYMKGPTATDEQLMLEYISGSWLSEPFVFADDTSHSYVELFEIKNDGTFTLKHLVPDLRNEKGYLDGSWEIDYQISGRVELLLDKECVLLNYTEFGHDYYFDRYIVETEDGKLILREYYDDAMTLSFDIVYTRVA